MQFVVDNRIHSSSFLLGRWALSDVYLKNDASFPWFILVPREVNVQEIYQLSVAQRHVLMDEIATLSVIVEDYFKPEKLNIGALGNIVSQLHIHVVGRFKTDKAWPQGIWQPDLTVVPYSAKQGTDLVQILSKKIMSVSHV